MQLGKLLKELNHNYRDLTSHDVCNASMTGPARRRRGPLVRAATVTPKRRREYYDLCTGFMVWAWGESLHFAPPQAW